MGLTNAKEFNQKLTDFIVEDIPREFKRRQIDIIVVLYRALYQNTPIRTGLARGNWRIAFKRMREDEGLMPLDSGEVRKPLADQAIRERLENIGKGIYSNSMVWVYNNLRYMKFIDGGTSKMPPRPIIAPAVEETKIFMSTYLKK